MIAFVVVAAVMVAGALLAVLPPLLVRRKAEVSERAQANVALLRRALEDNDAEVRAGAIDKARWEQNRSEIERRAIEESQAADANPPANAAAEKSPRIALAIGILLPLIAIPLYILLGEPRAITNKAPASEEAGAHPLQAEQIQAMAARLEEKLKAAPDDVEGWLMLSRTYAFLERLPEAMQALQNALKLQPDDARLLADYADMYAVVNGGSLMGEPEKIIQRALSLDPNQPKALALAGTIAFQRKDFALAAKHWERAVSVLPPDSPFAKQIAGGLAEAREAMGQGATAAPALPRAAAGGPMASATASAKAGGPMASATASAKAGGATGSAGGGTISGTLTLAPELAKKASPEDTLFLFARLPEGGAPLAVIRTKAGALPLNFKLDDSMGMGPENKLSAAPKVIVTARITKSGGVVPQPGDLEGVSAPVVPGASGLALRIDKERR